MVLNRYIDISKCSSEPSHASVWTFNLYTLKRLCFSAQVRFAVPLVERQHPTTPIKAMDRDVPGSPLGAGSQRDVAKNTRYPHYLSCQGGQDTWPRKAIVDKALKALVQKPWPWLQLFIVYPYRCSIQYVSRIDCWHWHMQQLTGSVPGKTSTGFVARSGGLGLVGSRNNTWKGTSNKLSQPQHHTQPCPLALTSTRRSPTYGERLTKKKYWVDSVQSN